MAEDKGREQFDARFNATSHTKDDAQQSPTPSIQARNLNYTFPDGTTGLQDINLSFPAGSRTLLIGANGAGKTTLLRLLSGKRLAPAGTITINGFDPFKDNLTGITYLGLEWVLNPIVRSDISVPTLLSSVGGDAYPSRRDELVRILDVDLSWHLHAVSDGERRRVQLVMGLLRPWDILLLDEVTVDLDLLSRRRFLEWLKKETERELVDGEDGEGRTKRARKSTIVYATHITDGLSDWPTHLVHMSMGRVKDWGPVETWKDPPTSVQEPTHTTASAKQHPGGGVNDGRDAEDDRKGRDLKTHPEKPKLVDGKLGDLVMRWLMDDLEERGPRNQPAGTDAGTDTASAIRTGTGTEISSQGKTYASLQGIGGYGSETRKS